MHQASYQKENVWFLFPLKKLNHIIFNDWSSFYRNNFCCNLNDHLSVSLQMKLYCINPFKWRMICQKSSRRKIKPNSVPSYNFFFNHTWFHVPLALNMRYIHSVFLLQQNEVFWALKATRLKTERSHVHAFYISWECELLSLWLSLASGARRWSHRLRTSLCVFSFAIEIQSLWLLTGLFYHVFVHFTIV